MEPKSSPTTQLPESMDQAIVKLSLSKPLQEINDWLNMPGKKSGSPGEKEKKGLPVLFYGRKKSGKLTYATMMATNAGKELYKVDLSKFDSKYIGETEKNLSTLFSVAEDKGWILFFDEADALFGKRTEVKDSHDKYANQEVAYLMQRIEEYKGLVILSSNLKSNIDQAFLRRLRYAIHFPPV